MASTPPAEPEPEPAEPEEADVTQEGKGDSSPLQDGVDTEQNIGDVGYSGDEAGNAVDDADVPAPGGADGVAGSETPQPPETVFPSTAQDRPQPRGTSSEQQHLDGDMHAKNSSRERGYPTSQAGGDDGAQEESIQNEHHFDGTMNSKVQSPVGFGVEDNAAREQSGTGDAEGFDSGGFGGRGIENDGMHPISSQPLHERHEGGSGGIDVDRHTGMGSSKGFGDEANDDSGSLGRRMFDGSRVAEPDDVQIVDAGEGADIIPGVDDLPVFANDQSKALNDEIKVRQGKFGRLQQ